MLELDFGLMKLMRNVRVGIITENSKGEPVNIHFEVSPLQAYHRTLP